MIMPATLSTDVCWLHTRTMGGSNTSGSTMRRWQGRQKHWISPAATRSTTSGSSSSFRDGSLNLHCKVDSHNDTASGIARQITTRLMSTVWKVDAGRKSLVSRDISTIIPRIRRRHPDLPYASSIMLIQSSHSGLVAAGHDTFIC